MTAQPATHITLLRHRHYGSIRRYIADEKQAAALVLLNRHVTVTDRDMEALLALGITFSEVDEP